MRWLVVAMIAGCGHSPGAGDDAASGGDGATDAPAGDGAGLCPHGQWCIETAPIDAATLLHGVFAVDANDVFAVGDGGTIVHRHAGAWQKMTSGTTENLRGVWAASATDAWAVGANATILRFDGSQWSPVTNVPGIAGVALAGVWGASPTDVWVIGTQLVTHYNGSAWSTSGLTGDHLQIAGAGPTDIWTAAENGYLHHYDGTWHLVDPGFGTSIYYAVWPIAASDVWASFGATSSAVAHWNGTWTRETLPPGVLFQCLWASSPSDVWGVSSTRVGHWAGTSWATEQPMGVTAPLWGIHGSGANVWAVGDNAMIVHRD